MIFEPPQDAAPVGAQVFSSVVGRVAGVGGDRIAAANGRLILNGQVVDEPYLSVGTKTDRLEATLVPPDSIYVLGDNRANARDSRSYGPVPDHDVQARVTFTNFPLDWITLAPLSSLASHSVWSLSGPGAAVAPIGPHRSRLPSKGPGGRSTLPRATRPTR